MKYVKLEFLEDHVARLLVDRPAVRNALNWEAMDEFKEVVDQLAHDPDVRVLLISGAGSAFISGADLGLVSSLDSRKEGERLSVVMGETLAALRSLPVISIAVINGPARGGGAEVAISCDLRIMSTEASIAFVQTSLGLIPGWGGANRLFDLVGYSRGLEYLASTKVIGSDEALMAGLVNSVYPPSELQTEALKLAQSISGNSWEAIREVKTLFLEWEGKCDLRRFAERERFTHLWDQENRREIFSKIGQNEHKNRKI